MNRAQLPSRRAVWVLWLCVLTVLVKSGMPLLANASAAWQGRALVEVCTVYGVATVAVQATPRHDMPTPAPDHAAEHCALTALGAFAGGEARAVWLAIAAPAAAPIPRVAAAGAVDDAAARWAARVRHGPPRTS